MENTVLDTRAEHLTLLEENHIGIFCEVFSHPALS